MLEKNQVGYDPDFNSCGSTEALTRDKILNKSSLMPLPLCPQSENERFVGTQKSPLAEKIQNLSTCQRDGLEDSHYCKAQLTSLSSPSFMLVASLGASFGQTASFTTEHSTSPHTSSFRKAVDTVD